MGDDETVLNFRLAIFIMLFLAAFVAFLCVIEFPIFLPKQNCLMYRWYSAGYGEMNYCEMRPEDDDVTFAFDHSEDNIVRSDSTVYLVPSPFRMYRYSRKFSRSFTDENYKKYHYVFPQDYIRGTVRCTECSIRVVSVPNSCDHYLSSTKYNHTDNMFLGKTGKKNCGPRSTYLVEKDVTGSYSFRAEIGREGPFYVYVFKRGAFKYPTGSVEYTLSFSRFNTSNAIAKCNDYRNCSFSNLTGYGRNQSYVAVNIFSDSMKGEYIVSAYYRPDKWENIWICVGFGAAVALFLVGAGVTALIFGIYLLVIYITDKPDEQKPPVEMKTEQVTSTGTEKSPSETPTQIGATPGATPGGESNAEPAPDYNAEESSSSSSSSSASSLSDTPMQAV